MIAEAAQPAPEATPTTQQAPATDGQATTPPAQQNTAEGTQQAQGGQSPETKQAGQEQPKDSARFLALAKKEKAILQKQQELKSKETELEQAAAKVKAYEDAVKQAKLNPMAFLEQQLGLKWDDLVQFQLNGGAPTPDMTLSAVDAKIEAFRQEQLKAQEELQKQAQEEEQRAVEEFHQEVASFVTTHADDYELINLNNQHQLVIDVIQENFRQHRKVLTAKEAADMVEDYLVKEVEKNVASKKFQARSAKPQDQKQGEQEQRAEKAGATRTLTNRMTPAQASTQTTTLTEEERYARARSAVRKLWEDRAKGVSA